jgi:uncharacterized protein YegJ (DUF2314 family)
VHVFPHGEFSPEARLDHEDPSVNEAIQEAKRSLNTFIAEFNRPNGRKFYVKKAFLADGGGVEHLFVRVRNLENGVFRGTLSNVPRHTNSLKKGQPIDVRHDEVTDWLIIDGQKEMGDFQAKAVARLQSKR